MEDVWGEWVAELLFGLCGLLESGEREEIRGLAFFRQREDEESKGDDAGWRLWWRELDWKRWRSMVGD